LVEKERILVASATINDPHHVLVELFARFQLFKFHRGMLELNNESSVSLDVGDMLFTSLSIKMDDLVPLFVELILPSTMPRGFGLPPRVAMH
jgi:hypothetical protein